MELWEELWLALKGQLLAALAAIGIGWTAVFVPNWHPTLISSIGLGILYHTIGAGYVVILGRLVAAGLSKPSIDGPDTGLCFPFNAFGNSS